MGYKGTDTGNRKSRQAAKIKGSSLVFSSPLGYELVQVPKVFAPTSFGKKFYEVCVE